MNADDGMLAQWDGGRNRPPQGSPHSHRQMRWVNHQCPSECFRLFLLLSPIEGTEVVHTQSGTQDGLWCVKPRTQQTNSHEVVACCQAVDKNIELEHRARIDPI